MTRLMLGAGVAAVLLGAIQASAVTLYDATSGVEMNQTPWAWSYRSLPAASTHGFDAGLAETTLTTSAANSAGYGVTTPGLSLATGFTATFRMDVKSESHTSANRAGGSVILLSSNSSGIELGFWGGEIWAQNDINQGAYFTHGEGNTGVTTAGLHDYRLTMMGTSYTLYQDNVSVLTGPVRNYIGYGNPVYAQTNFMFIGDDTSEAGASLGVQQVTVPEPATMGLLTLAGVGVMRRRGR